jgi:hypothetical protein
MHDHSMRTKLENDLLEGLRDAVAHASGEYRPGRRLRVVQVQVSGVGPQPTGSGEAQDDQERHDA